VAWNPFDENVLATGATNGAVVSWNLQKASRSKMGKESRNEFLKLIVRQN